MRKFHILNDNKNKNTITKTLDINIGLLTQSDAAATSEILELWETEGAGYNVNHDQQTELTTSLVSKQYMTAVTPYKSRSTFNPIMPRDSIDVFHENVVVQLKKLQAKTWSTKRKYDKTTHQYEALISKLQKEKKVLVRGSDKGGNVVLLTKEEYDKEAYQQLNDRECYARSSLAVIKGSYHEYYQKLSKWRTKKLITEDEYKFLKNDNPVIPSIYLIPKIHKNCKNPPGRPIIAAIKSLTENISIYIDYFLQDFVKSLNSFVQDTSDFLRKIQAIPWETEYWMLALDVTSLYTSIKHEDGIQAISYYFTRRPHQLRDHTEMLLQMLYFCLHNNFYV